MSEYVAQHGGTHYEKGAYQHWDWVLDTGLGYFEGNATKYIVRHRNKNGLEDIRKARTYIEKLMTKIVAVLPAGQRPGRYAPLTEAIVREYSLENMEARFVRLVDRWESRSDLVSALALVDQMIMQHPDRDA